MSLVASKDIHDFRARYVPDYLRPDKETFQRFKNSKDKAFTDTWMSIGKPYEGNV